MQNPKGIALLVGLKQVNPANYNGWDGQNGCWGCELDVDNMAEILNEQGFTIEILKTESATHNNILNKISDIANDVNSDDIFVFYYSGHGGQQPDCGSDELDERDETLVVYDQEIIDDELYQHFKLFPVSSRIVMISDSCNSGTNYKGMRDIPFHKALPINPIPRFLKSKDDDSFQMIHMGGCRDGGSSQGYQGGGAFTISLCDAWANGEFVGSYKDWFEAAKGMMQSPQEPQYNEFGQITETFRDQKPFTIGFQNTSDEDRQTIWRAIEIIDSMDILTTSIEKELISAVNQVIPSISEKYQETISNFKPEPWLDHNEAMQIAQNEVNNMIGNSSGEWPMGAQVIKTFPVFIPGQATPSYYECKVIDKDGQNAGYVLVNVDRTDLLISEAAVDGPTMTERYQERLHNNNFQFMRLDWVRSLAVETNAVGRSMKDLKGAILDAEGFIVDDTKRSSDALQSKLLSDYCDVYEQSRCFLHYDHVALNEYYAEIEDEIELLKSAEIRAARGSTRTKSASLQDTFSSSGWHTPAWRQFNKPNGYAIGCGNAAWAISLAYFKQFHSKSCLFDNVNVDTQIMSDEIKECMERCAKLCETWDVADQGLTWPIKMCRGIGYAKENGYANSRCVRDRGSEYSKFDKVYNHLQANKPSILLIHHDGLGVADHYVVIEAGKKTQYKRLRKWYDRDVKYLCNFGWGSTRKWIYVRDWGSNQNQVYSSFSVFLPDVH